MFGEQHSNSLTTVVLIYLSPLYIHAGHVLNIMAEVKFVLDFIHHWIETDIRVYKRVKRLYRRVNLYTSVQRSTYLCTLSVYGPCKSNFYAYFGEGTISITSQSWPYRVAPPPPFPDEHIVHHSGTRPPSPFPIFATVWHTLHCLHCCNRVAHSPPFSIAATVWHTLQSSPPPQPCGTTLCSPRRVGRVKVTSLLQIPVIDTLRSISQFTFDPWYLRYQVN